MFRRVSSVPLVSRHGSFMQDFITLPLTSRMSYIFFFLCSSGNDAGSRSRITNTFICNQLLMRETERFHFLSSTVSATTHNQHTTNQCTKHMAVLPISTASSVYSMWWVNARKLVGPYHTDLQLNCALSTSPKRISSLDWCFPTTGLADPHPFFNLHHSISIHAKWLSIISYSSY